MYTTILWDLDNTLLNFTMSERYAFNTCMENAGISPTEELLSTYSRINQSFWKMLERGEITKEVLLRQRFVRFFEAAGITGVDVTLFKDTYQQLLGSVFYYLDDSLALCQKLSGSFRQYVVTNGVAATQRSKLQRSHLADCLDGFFISEELGAEKPSPVFFEKVFARIPGFSREDTILIGDSLTSDMLGANQAGIACCWYNPAGAKCDGTVRVDYEIRHLGELETIL